MSITSVLLVCAQAVFIQTITAQWIGGYEGCGAWPAAPAAPCAPAPCGPMGYGPAAFPASNGGGFTTASSSPLIPSGVSVVSENAYEGTLAVGGAVPFLGTVAIEGTLPTAGAGAIAYGCGNGAVGITAEDVGAYGYGGLAGPLGYGAGLAGPGYGPGLAGPGYGPGLAGPGYGYGPGCGCGGYY